MIKKYAFSMILIIAFIAIACSKDDDAPAVPEILDITWYHSYEEDTDNYQVYRAEGYDFPPARFRYGFQLQTSGSGWEFEVGPADVPVTVAGQWQFVEEENAFHLSLQNNEMRIFEVVDHRGELLKLIVK